MTIFNLFYISNSFEGLVASELIESEADDLSDEFLKQRWQMCWGFRDFLGEPYQLAVRRGQRTFVVDQLDYTNVLEVKKRELSSVKDFPNEEISARLRGHLETTKKEDIPPWVTCDLGTLIVYIK